VIERCQYLRVGTAKVGLTPALRDQLLSKIKEWGTGRDTLRCLALATHDVPPRKEDMDLENASKFAQYEVKQTFVSGIRFDQICSIFKSQGVKHTGLFSLFPGNVILHEVFLLLQQISDEFHSARC